MNTYSKMSWPPLVVVFVILSVFAVVGLIKAVTATTTIGSNIDTGGTLTVSGAIYASSTMLIDGAVILAGGASTTSITLLSGETISNETDGVISLMGIASSTSIRLGNLETITNSTNGTITLANDGGATISFTPATGTITPSGGALLLNATSTAGSIFIPAGYVDDAAAPDCYASNLGGLILNSTNNELCICNGTAWVKATTTAATTCY